jgi:hypothetical protein
MTCHSYRIATGLLLAFTFLEFLELAAAKLFTGPDGGCYAVEKSGRRRLVAHSHCTPAKP